jgi:predicted ATPase
MPNNNPRLSRFWQELRQRKVLPFVIGYIAACFAILTFLLDSAEIFTVPKNTLKLLYIIAALCLPVVIILPWFINRKRQELSPEDMMLQEFNLEPRRIKVLHNLPAHLPGFIGREKEIGTISELVSENRLVTLTGAGGCGKTRLAIQFASQLVPDYSDGIWMVELAPVTIPDYLDQAIAEVFKIKERPGSSLISIISHYLSNKKLLLILDNCEHLIEACSDIVEQILKSTEHVSILCTSREALNVSDEVAWRVPSLSLPENGTVLSVDEANQYEAVQLFVARAKNKQADFILSEQNVHPVLQICKRLDGIPLAIELAASRVHVLNPELIVNKLDDRFRLLTGGSRTALERHKTLQATIDWSYDLLSEKEKKVFHQLSVFVDGFDFDAYEHICKTESAEQEELTDILTSLIEKSLVIAKTMESGSYRYQLLETIRHYAKEKLFESGELDAVRGSHYRYYKKLSEQAYKENAREYAYWYDRLELEHENIIAALEWIRQDIEKRLQLAGFLGWYWYDRGHNEIGLKYLKDAENCPQEASLTKARALISHAYILFGSGDMEGLSKVDSSLELWDKLENREDKVKSLYQYVIVKGAMQDYEVARNTAQEMKEIALQLDDKYLLLQSKAALLWIYTCQLQVDLAEPLAAQSLKDALALNESMVKQWILHFYSDCAIMRKDFNEAEKRYSAGIKGYLEKEQLQASLVELTGMVYALSGQGRYKKALRIMGAVYAKWDEFGLSLPQVRFWMDWFEEYVNGAREAVGEEKAGQYEQEGRQMGFENAVEYALDFKKD